MTTHEVINKNAAKKRRMGMEIAYRRQTMEEFFASRIVETGRVTYAGTPKAMSAAVVAYEMGAFITPGNLN